MANDLSNPMKAANAAASNVAMRKVLGAKKREVLFSASFANDTVGFVNSKTRLFLDQQGDLQSTGISTDFAINGAGMIAVKQNPNDPMGQTVFTRSCSFCPR